MLASTYTYPSASEGKLPFQHAKFPEGQTPNPWRYYHGRPSRLGQQQQRQQGSLPKVPTSAVAVERTFYKTVWQEGDVRPSLKLPRLEAVHSQRHAAERRNTFSKYIQDYKARIRIKGMDTSKIFSLRRGQRYEHPRESKPGPSNPKSQATTTQQKGPRRQRSMSLPTLFLQEGRQGTDLSDASVTTGVSSVAFSDINQDLKLRLHAKLECDVTAPGYVSRRGRRRRKLGGIMTSERLVELLEDDEKTLPYTYYRTTIVSDLKETSQTGKARDASEDES